MAGIRAPEIVGDFAPCPGVLLIDFFLSEKSYFSMTFGLLVLAST